MLRSSASTLVVNDFSSSMSSRLDKWGQRMEKCEPTQPSFECFFLKNMRCKDTSPKPNLNFESEMFPINPILFVLNCVQTLSASAPLPPDIGNIARRIPVTHF